jgi:hypothetical protein
MATIPPSDRRMTHTGTCGAPAALRSSAKLSNEAVKCRKYDAVQQADYNI